MRRDRDHPPLFEDGFMKLMLVAALLGLACGCTTSRVQVAKDVEPKPVPKGHALCMPVVLHIDDSLRNHVLKPEPETFHGMNTTFEFEVGRGASRVIEATMRNLFPEVESSSVLPSSDALRAGKKAGVMDARLRSSTIQIEFEPKVLGALAKGQYVIELDVEFRDPSGATLFKTTAKGSGFSKVQTMNANAESFLPCIDLAIQDAVEAMGEAILASEALRGLARPCDGK
jgi:hypothetical protein